MKDVLVVMSIDIPSSEIFRKYQFEFINSIITKIDKSLVNEKLIFQHWLGCYMHLLSTLEKLYIKGRTRSLKPPI